MRLPLSKNRDEVLPEIRSESREIHELELAKIESLKSAKKAFMKSIDLMPIAIFILVFIVAFALWWFSFR